MLSPEEIDLIHKYLENNLSQEEITVFKDKFNTNSEFAKEVKRYTDIGIALRTASSYRLRSGKKAKIIKISWMKMAVAASLALLIGLGGFFTWRSLQQPMHQKLYASYYDNPLENDKELIARSEISQADSKSFDKFVRAIELMEQKQFNKAIELLESINNIEDERLMDEVEWYLALSYLRADEKQKAIDLLTYILNSNSVHSHAARNIYNELSVNKQ